MISIVITTFNRRHIIQRAINSAINFLKNIDIKSEIIIIDDHSSDDTKDFIEQRYYKEIRNNFLSYYYLKKNLGVSGAKNIGFLRAKFKWVVFFDSDDELIANNARDFYDALLKNDDAALLFFRCVDQNGNFVGQKFNLDKRLDFNEYLLKTSYGEALTVINKQKNAKTPYYTKLRGYEGLGCLDIIYRHGFSVLVNVIARVYYMDSSERLSSFWGFISRSQSVARGHFVVVKKYGRFMGFKRKLKLIILANIYFWAGKIYKILFAERI